MRPNKGRKRHLLVDTLGLVPGAVVTPASTPERDGAQAVLNRVPAWFIGLHMLWVDGGFTGANFADWVKALRPKLAVEVVKRSDETRGFKVPCCTAGWSSAPSAVCFQAPCHCRLNSFTVMVTTNPFIGFQL